MMDKLIKNNIFVLGAVILVCVLTLKYFVDRSASKHAAAVSAAEEVSIATTASPTIPIAKKNPAIRIAASSNTANIDRANINKNAGVEMARIGGYSALPPAKKYARKGNR